MARRIRENGFREDLRCDDLTRIMSDEELTDLLDAELPTTGNDIADNVLYRVHTKHMKNPNNKVWRGDIEACFAKLKKQIMVCLCMNMVKNPSAFGWDEDEWMEVASGRRAHINSVEIEVLLEAFRCPMEKDQAYLYQRLKYIIDPHPVTGLVGIPIYDYRFWRV